MKKRSRAEMEIEDEDEGYYNLPEPTINKLQKLSSPSQDEITRPTTLKQDLFENNNDTSLSQFEKHQLSLKSTISHLESESIAQKPWQLLGESSKNRPLNALLEEDLEIDYTAKPVPIITQETTKSLEDLIKDRISDAIFDSVERKIITTKTYNPNKRIEMDDEKSKLSLAQVYENEYKSLKNTILKTQKDLKIEKTHMAIKKRDLSAVQQLVELGVNFKNANAIDSAALNGNLDIVQWLHLNSNEGCSSSAMDFAATCGSFEVVKFLHENRSEGCDSAIYCAATKGHFEIVKYLVLNNLGIRNRRAVHNAIKYSSSFQIWYFLLTHTFGKIVGYNRSFFILVDLAQVTAQLLIMAIFCNYYLIQQLAGTGN